METETVGTEADARTGMEPSAWLGGLGGGIVGAAAFGLLMWAVSPEFLRATIPAIYGLEATTTLGWLIHLLHGAVLGLVFAVAVTRRTVSEWLAADAETHALSSTGSWLRLAGAGLVYGLAIWAVLPMVVLPAWLGTLGNGGADVVAGIGMESLLGHAVYGVLLGLVYAAVVDRT